MVRQKTIWKDLFLWGRFGPSFRDHARGNLSDGGLKETGSRIQYSSLLGSFTVGSSSREDGP